MGQDEGRKKKEQFEKALLGKNVPILTLDNKWYRLLGEVGKDEIEDLEEQLNALLKRQGKINTETKELRKLKKKLMNEIVAMVDEAAQTGEKSLDKKIEKHKCLVEECNEKLDAYKDEIMELPGEIEKCNRKLMVITMERCYDIMQDNAEDIRAIADWVTEVRINLKKQLIRKQEMERKNQEIYAYMHDIFGADVVDMFDMTYVPKEPPADVQNAQKDASEEESR